jgi:hypothetical protein
MQLLVYALGFSALSESSANRLGGSRMIGNITSFGWFCLA